MINRYSQLQDLTRKALIKEQALTPQELDMLSALLMQAPIDVLRRYANTWHVYILPDRKKYYANPAVAQSALRVIDACLGKRENERVLDMTPQDKVRALRRIIKDVRKADTDNLWRLSWVRDVGARNYRHKRSRHANILACAPPYDEQVRRAMLELHLDGRTAAIVLAEFTIREKNGRKLNDTLLCSTLHDYAYLGKLRKARFSFAWQQFVPKDPTLYVPVEPVHNMYTYNTGNAGHKNPDKPKGKPKDTWYTYCPSCGLLHNIVTYRSGSRPAYSCSAGHKWEYYEDGDWIKFHNTDGTLSSVVNPNRKVENTNLQLPATTTNMPGQDYVGMFAWNLRCPHCNCQPSAIRQKGDLLRLVCAQNHVFYYRTTTKSYEETAKVFTEWWNDKPGFEEWRKNNPEYQPWSKDDTV